MRERLRVVLADDILPSLQAWESLLRGTCDVVATARNGVSALEAIVQFNPDVAVLDLNMPGLDGIKTTRAALRVQPNLAVVICSVCKDPEIVQAAAEAGARAYVCKMDFFRELLPAVTAAAAGATYFPKPEETATAAVQEITAPL